MLVGRRVAASVGSEVSVGSSVGLGSSVSVGVSPEVAARATSVSVGEGVGCVGLAATAVTAGGRFRRLLINSPARQSKMIAKAKKPNAKKSVSGERPRVNMVGRGSASCLP